MAGRLSFSVAINLLTENFKKGANQVQSLFSKMKGSVLGFAAVLGIGGASLRNFIETTAGFEAAVSKLSAILGTTPGQIKALTDNAKKLGETTKYTAAEVTNLQTELAKLGFTKNEILSATESVLKFAQATDSELAEAAALAGASLRMFGAEATESKRYVSAMSIATTKSALSFSYLRDALPTVGPVAKAFNFEIEDTLALLGKLADSGFDASSAATATRNILLNLADSGGKLATALGKPVKSLPELVSGLQKLRDKGVDLNTTLQLTDKRSVAAFNAFLQSADKITPLREAITGVEGDLDQMAATMGDNVKGAMAGLGSAWEALMVKMSETTNGPLKGLIKWITDLLRDIKSGFTGMVTFVAFLISGKLLQSIIAFFAKQWAFIDTSLNKAKVSEEQKLLATQTRIEAEKALEAELTAFETMENGKRLGSKQRVKKAEIALAKAAAAEKRAILSAETAEIKAASLRSTTVWGKMGKTVTLGFAKVFQSIKMLFSTFWVTALITAIGSVIGKMVNMYTEAKRIKSIFSDYKAEAAAIQPSAEVSQLEALRDIAGDINRSDKERKKALDEIASRLNVIKGKNESDLDYQKRINDKIKDRIKLLEETARAEFYAQQKVSAEHEFKTLKKDLKLQGMKEGNLEYMMSNIAKYKDTGSKTALQKAIDLYSDEARKAGVGFSKDYQNKLVEMSNYWQIMVDSSKEMADATANSLNLKSDKVTVAGDKKDNEPLKKAEEEYHSSLKNYRNQLDAGAITQDQYNTAIDRLNADTVVKLGGILGKSADANKTYADALLGTLNPQVTESSKIQAELAKVQDEYNQSIKLAKDKLDRKLISEEEYREAIISAAESAANSAISIKGIGDAADEFINKLQDVSISNISAPTLGKRDTTFDYKASQTDKISGELDVWSKYKEELEQLKKEHKGLSDDLQDKLNTAIANVDSLEKALKIAQVKQDIKDFSKDLNEGIYSGIKDIASSSDRVVSSFSQLRDVMNDVDATEWERIMVVWNAMTNVVDSFLSIVKMIENLTEITNKLTQAKETESVVDTELTGTKVANAATETAATATAATTQAAVQVAASKAISEAATIEMAAKSTAAYAAIPFAGSALAAAQIAAMEAMIMAASIPKFANGGIVSNGPTSGDRILARVNAGEMILNGSQQANLFDAINSGRLGGNTNVIVSGEAKLRGDTAFMQISNYMKKTGKRLPL